MNPETFLPILGGSLLGKFDHLTLFATLAIVVVFLVYKNEVWPKIRP